MRPALFILATLLASLAVVRPVEAKGRRPAPAASASDDDDDDKPKGPPPKPWWERYDGKEGSKASRAPKASAEPDDRPHSGTGKKKRKAKSKTIIVSP